MIFVFSIEFIDRWLYVNALFVYGTNKSEKSEVRYFSSRALMLCPKCQTALTLVQTYSMNVSLSYTRYPWLAYLQPIICEKTHTFVFIVCQ